MKGATPPTPPVASLWKGASLCNGGCNIFLMCNVHPSLSNFSVLCFLIVLSVHAAVIAINEAVDRRIPADTFAALKNPNAMLINLEEPLASTYQDVLYQAKQDKMTNAKNKVKIDYILSSFDKTPFKKISFIEVYLIYNKIHPF